MATKIDSEILKQFQTRFAQVANMPPVVSKVLEEFSDVDIKADRIANTIRRNQYYEHWLIQEIKALGLKDNVPSLDAAIVLLGMQNVREFICALYLIRAALGRKPTVGKDGKLDPKPKDLLKFAVKTEEYVQARRLQNTDTAFAAGLLFDIVAITAREHFKASKTFDELLGEVYKQGLRAAMIGLEISKTMKSFAYTRYAFSACLLRDIGKLVMHAFFAEKYDKLRSDLQKKPVNRVVRMFLEERHFGFTHEYLSSELVWNYKILRPAARPILYHHEPFLCSPPADQQAFSGLVGLASQISANYRIPKDTSDPVFNTWFAPETSRLQVDRKAIVNIMGKMSRESF